MVVDDDSPKPPKELEQRAVTIQTYLANIVLPTDIVNTVEVPCDPRDPDFARWFDTSTGMQEVRKNHVKALVDGPETFVAMAAAIQTADLDGDYIYMSNWFAGLDLELDPAGGPKTGAASTKLGDLLSNAVSHGVQVRALFWKEFGIQNYTSVKAINKLSNPSVPDANGGAILDNNTLNNYISLEFGCHHQKILIVKGNERLIAFCGGVDPNPDRVASVPQQPGSPMHDVHCSIVGPAAFDLLKIFLDRWTDHPESASIDAAKGALRGLKVLKPGDQGEQYVQIGRTFGNGSAHPGIKNSKGLPFYSFAPSGERTAEKLIFNAIEKAQQFIYVEDQYLVSMDASNKLLAQLPKLQRLVILIPHPSLSTHPWIWDMEKAFIDNLKGDPKVVVCYPKVSGATPNPKVVPPTTIHTYVHAKMWIMDDKFAIIGAANCNQRGYTHDSEVVAGIYDESKDTPCTLHFAHRLRIRLWAEHLNLPPAAVFDPIGSAGHWFTPALSSRVAVFNQNADKDNPLKPSNWVSKNMAEPFGG